MNVRVHKRDFTTEDFPDVERVRNGWSGEVVIENSDYDELARFERDDITSIEIRV